ncbi:MAG: hypothetical protein QE274_00190 [Verrucomicrobiaceae bacterium]|nr:hypothetical protein [Verrucomicrobiaceae bacterium]
MAADIQSLKNDYLFEAGLRFMDVSEKRTWLADLYLAESEDRSGGEVTSTAFEGSASSVQFRGSTPEDRRAALRQAIEHLDALLAEEVAAASAPRLFGIRFTDAPAAVL